MKNIILPIPPPSDQQQIADYLDHETAEIDALVSDLERLQELLHHRLKAWIERKVWPEVTSTAPLRRIIQGVDQGISPEASSVPAGPAEVGVLKAGCTNNGIFNVHANKRITGSHNFTPSMFVRAGDLIVTRASGSTRHVGSAAVVPPLDRELAMSDKHYRLITSQDYDSEFLSLVMTSTRFRSKLEPLISGAAGLAKNISIANLKATPVPNLLRTEQTRIVASAQHHLGVARRAEEEITRVIELSQERRAALISAAVTGQIDVTAKHKPVAEQLEDELAEAR